MLPATKHKKTAQTWLQKYVSSMYMIVFLRKHLCVVSGKTTIIKSLK